MSNSFFRPLIERSPWIVVLCLVAGISRVAYAQTSNGTLVGSVADPQGAAVEAATVTAISAQYGAPHPAQTDSLGTYRIESLQPGMYTVAIRKAGFDALTVTGVAIYGSATTTVNGNLKIAEVQQTVEVEAGAGQVFDTQSGQLGETLTSREIAHLPYFSLNPVELSLTLPGVHDTPQGQGAVNTFYTNGFAFSVNGTRPRSNNFLIDGQDDNDYEIAGQAFQPTNVGAIQEVTILTNAYSAEYGRGGGSVSNYIYKSGTNAFHGDVWEINRNSAVAAIPAEDEVSNPITKNPFDNDNTFGFDFGGPLKKDKLFLFGTAQWDRERQQAIGSVFKLPTANGIATLKTLLPNANISLLLAAIGGLESPGLNGVTNIALGNARPDVEIGDVQSQTSAASNSVEWNIRTDWHISDRDRLTGSILRSNQTLSPDIFSNGGALPNFQTQQGGPSDIYRGQWVRILSSRAVNELRLSRASFDFEFQPTAATLAGPLANTPFVSFGPDLDFPRIGVDDRFPQGRAHRTWQVQDGLTFEKRRHTLKAGADITLVSIRDLNGITSRGAITYSSGTDGSGATYSSLGNFIDDYTGADPGGISRTFGNPAINPSDTIYALYVEDVWRVRGNLTLNLGLRYESWGTIANSLNFPAFNAGLGFGVPSGTFPGMYSSKQIPDRKNFAPRIGLAYTPRWGSRIFGENKTVIRAGYGIFYDGLFSDIVDLTATSEPNISGGSLPPPAGRGYANASTAGLSSITQTEDPTLAVTTMASNIRNPMTQQWNVDVQRELPWGLVVTVAYVGTRGEHLFVNQDFNGQINYAFANPNFGEISVRTNGGDSRYNSGQLEIERKMHSGLTFRASYAYSKFMDDASEIFPTTTGTSTFSQDLTNQKSDWGPSAFDQRHRFTLAYVWELPYSRRNGFLRALTERWQSSSIVTFETGTPNTVEIGFDNIGNGHPNSRPDLANLSAPLNSFGIDGGDIGPPYASGIYYDFICAYVKGNTNCPAEPLSTFHFVVPNTVPGNVGRDTLYGPGQIYFDTSVQRDFSVRFWKQEGAAVQFRTEFFNALNHPNLFTPSYTMKDPNFNNTAITINGGRQIKFWLKYSF